MASNTQSHFPALLTTYADAVARRAYWEDHGTRRDGHLERARENERVARVAVMQAHRDSERSL